MDNSWKEIFKDYPKRNELGITVDNINKKRQTATIYPPKELVFKVFDLPLQDIKVVILGQDPYHNPGQACGLSFSVNDGVPLPKSLINIYKELYDDLGITPAKTGNLEKWFKQGIFLLNSVLTVEEYSPASHSNVGWQDFTDYIIETISQKNNNVVFVLWGSYARSKKTLIDNSRHKIIESPHPSPLSAYRGFFGSKVFSRINSYLEEVGKKPIDFNLEN
ncbi:uracil-DNA glycosylase [Gemella morbillorum]|jgi:uracil-DNA glycosylase|uniref:Uracil-DNA glycosylase n=1 Tax=Gemella morbillorum TaxID=29391 RepID=A0AAP9HC55_9BACL|nr:uracil-DNA glycosylase [Gemella morbillorum]EFV35010.1 uracil-DNA glycosylase [Gemella morbillorum M424]MDK8238973.1 uracil-DNA glycosylase [Gemella morbillorum]MDK8254380.1 uracil-DNA glycosylase [Gemella morbillorum]QGS09045.1 uracil-DNA glycosylase [Gemella morbillorum]